MTQWLTDHKWITFIIIYVCITYIYNKVFRVRRLPILKELIIYLMLGLGAAMLLFFQVVPPHIPIVPSMLVAIGLMMLVKVRYWVEGRGKK